jgi:LacI family transcriptional regulator
VFVQPDYPALADGAEPPARGVLRSDDATGFAAAVDHLMERGYRQFAYVGPGSGSSDALRRVAASEALERHGLGPMRFLDSGPNGWRDASLVAERVASDPPEAVICYDDKLALSLLDALRATPLDVPRDLALVGFDGIPAARQGRPRLTTLDVPSIEIGRRAVDMLLASTRDGGPAPSQVVPVRLIVGESTPVRTGGADATLVAPREDGR